MMNKQQWQHSKTLVKNPLLKQQQQEFLFCIAKQRLTNAYNTKSF